jgi:hypothetical protein
VLQPDNVTVNARRAHDPALRGRVTVEPDGRRQTADGSPTKTVAIGTGSPSTLYRLPSAVSDKVTTADVLEALHRATGMPIIADYYTRLYPPEVVTVHDRPLFEALNQLGDAMRMRWHKEGDTRESGAWLEFRSTSFYDDRLKEVPNRLLTRWAAMRRLKGMLALDDLIEIAHLPDAQLDGAEMAEGARECFGLAEWDLARHGGVRAHLRYLAGFTPAQRQQAMGATGLPLTEMSLVQQQGFLAHGLRPRMQPLQSLEDLAGAVLRIDYRQPGEFEWRPPGPFWLQWIAPLEPGENGQRIPCPVVRGRTREETLQALRVLDPKLREALAQAAPRFDPHTEAGALLSPEAQIVPTELDLTIIYIPGTSNKIAPILIGPHTNWNSVTW